MASDKHSNITAALNTIAAKEKTLAVLKSYFLQPQSAEYKLLSGMSADDLLITPFGNQGLSRATYMVSNADRSLCAVLAVSLPRDSLTQSTLLARASQKDIHAFTQKLAAANIVVQSHINPSFRIPGIAHPCEMTTYIHGYQVVGTPKGTEAAWSLSDTELCSMAETQARMHNACVHFVPPGFKKPHSITSRPLPQGFIHADYNVGNVLFDPATHQIAGVIDFEMAHYNTFAYDIARMTARKFMDFSVSDGKPHMTLHADKMMRYIEAYSRTRTLNPKEADAVLEHTIERIHDRLRLLRPKHVDIAEATWEKAAQDFTNEVRTKFKPGQFVKRQTERA